MCAFTTRKGTLKLAQNQRRTRDGEGTAKRNVEGRGEVIGDYIVYIERGSWDRKENEETREREEGGGGGGAGRARGQPPAGSVELPDAVTTGPFSAPDRHHCACAELGLPDAGETYIYTSDPTGCLREVSLGVMMNYFKSTPERLCRAASASLQDSS
ncbi:hypothetical protein NDU88_005501 [Pleurodeles waltl]|uniref:Uncharacterized protein n=1 Tax=Pleurodeles waltl TaxID=8319 RepID=A0AAV7TB66_PLEWA|nr:hypothetical protein NDU88_005501 [Pleurodeles waltl]